ncbi:MAG: S8 family serine peptidase [Candidatus Omnitrophota bacterium]
MLRFKYLVTAYYFRLLNRKFLEIKIISIFLLLLTITLSRIVYADVVEDSFPAGLVSIKSLDIENGYDHGLNATAAYTIPLDVLTETNGVVQPSIVLRYFSETGSSSVDGSWNIDLGKITRSARLDSLKFNDDDIFILQLNNRVLELVKVGNGQFRTKIKSFLRINKIDSGWIVTDENGVNYEYNYNVDDLNYYLTKIIDTNEDYVEVTYFSSGNIGYIDQIEHIKVSGSSKLKTIKFLYQDQTDNYPDDLTGKVVTAPQLNCIDIKIDGSLYQKYDFSRGSEHPRVIVNKGQNVYSYDNSGSLVAGNDKSLHKIEPIKRLDISFNDASVNSDQSLELYKDVAAPKADYSGSDLLKPKANEDEHNLNKALSDIIIYPASDAPGSPQNVNASLTECYDEINVSWDRSPDSDIAGYRVYYGSAPGNYDGFEDIPDPDATSYQLAIKDVRGDSGGLGGASMIDSESKSVESLGANDYVSDELIIKIKKESAEATQGLIYKIRNFLGRPDLAPDSRIPKTVKSLNNKLKIKKVKRAFKAGVKRKNKTKESKNLPDLENIYVIKLSQGADIRAIIKEYQNDSSVEYAEPNYIERAFDGLESENYYIAVTAYNASDEESLYSGESLIVYQPPSDPYFRSNLLWGESYSDMWGLHRIKAEQAWPVEKGSDDIIVAVIDTGCDYNHKDLADNIWINFGEIPDNGIDDDENGFVDDIRGWDFAGSILDSSVQDNNPIDIHGHGTHVAGTIAAVTDNYEGVAGISWQSKIMIIKGLDDDGVGAVEGLANAIKYAADNGARILNNSWGGCGVSLTIEAAVDYAHSLDCVVVAAAGNDYKDANLFHPACCKNVITVGALDADDELAYFSNWGDKIDVIAPGVDILSLSAKGKTMGDYCLMSGTSMACPHTVGLAALILSKNPELNNEEVRQILRNSAEDLGPQGKDSYFGYGLINAQQALQFDSICLAEIYFSQSNGHISGNVDMIGTAQGSNFANYIIEYGNGYNPAVWSTEEVTLSDGGINEVSNGVLGVFNTDNLSEGNWTVRLSVFDSEGSVSQVIRTVVIDRSLHSGWPINNEGYNSSASPTYADLDGDGVVDSVILCTNILEDFGGEVHVWNSEGAYLSGWPKKVGNLINMAAAVGDIDGDGDKEIIAAVCDANFYDKGYIYAWHHNGELVDGWPIESNYPARTTSPVLADLDGDEVLDIIVCGYNYDKDDSKIYAYKGDSTNIVGWPAYTSDSLDSTPAVGDIDGDGEVEIIALAGWEETKIYAWHKNGEIVNGWPRELEGYGIQWSSPALADIDLDGKLEIITGVLNYDWVSDVKIYALNEDGSNVSGWPRSMADTEYISSICLADLDSSGDAEVIFITDFMAGCALHILGSSGMDLPGWPKYLESKVNESPIVVDLEGDGQYEIIAGTSGVYSNIYIWDIAGNELTGWPKKIKYGTLSSPAIGDLDNDGFLELLAALEGEIVYQWDLPYSYSKSKLAWPMFRGNAELTGVYAMNSAPTLSGLLDQNLEEDIFLNNVMDLYQYADDAESSDSELTFTVISNTNPECGVSIDSNQYIDIQPENNWYGQSDVIIRVTDPQGLYAQDTFHIVVTSVNDAPAITPQVPNPVAVDEDNLIIMNLSSYETDDEDSAIDLNWTVTGADFCIVSGENSADDILTFTPHLNYYGQDIVTLILTGSEGQSDTQDITLTWLPVNDAPQLTPIGSKAGDEGQLLEFTVTASDPDPEDALTLSASSLPLGADFNPDTGLFSWTPDYSQADIYTEVRFEVTDADLTDTEDITITVNNVDITPPQTIDNYDGLWHKEDCVIYLTANDSESLVKETYYKINDSPVYSLSIAGQPLISTEGDNNTLEYWSVDEIDNEEIPHNILNGIKLDKQVPTINMISPQDESAVAQTPANITGSAQDSLSGLKTVDIEVDSKIYKAVIDDQNQWIAENIDLTEGLNNIKIIAADNAGNQTQINTRLFLGWLLHLDLPYYPIEDYYSGSACCQMVLNYIRNTVAEELTQELIYNYGHTFNYPENLELAELDPQAIDYALGHFDPYDPYDPGGQGHDYRGYTFDVWSFEADEFTEYLRDIIHWMAFPVKIGPWWLDGDLAAWPNTPAVVPAYGTYNHWIVVNGAVTSENPAPEPYTNPYYTPDFTVHGLWLTDPFPQGIGQDLYVTPQEAQDTYFLPVVSLDQHNGKYIQVAEPPKAQSDAEIEIAEPQANDETAKLIEIANDIKYFPPLKKGVREILSEFEQRQENFKKHIYDAALSVNLEQDSLASNKSFLKNEEKLLNSVFNKNIEPLELDWKKIVPPALLTDENFKKAFNQAQARNFVKVRRIDKENSFYYLIPFDKYIEGQFLTYAALIIDAQDGSFKQASWVKEPTRFVQIDKEEAAELLLLEHSHLCGSQLNIELAWKPQGYSESPFYPYWKISANNEIYFVNQDKEIIKK